MEDDKRMRDLHTLDKWRLDVRKYCGSNGDDKNGAFKIFVNGRALFCIASNGRGWEHVSVSPKNQKRCPTWEEMCAVKNLFFEPEETVIQADNFNDIRQVTVINCLQGDVLFQMTGKMSITADTEDNQLEIVVEDENGEYKKHFIGLSDNVTYVVEDVTSGDVNQYKYTLNFNPKMWLPEISTIE